MKTKLVTAACVLAASTAWALSRTWSETQALTRAAPTLATEGMDLAGLRGFRICVHANAGQTLSGAGNLRAWVYNNDPSGAVGWARNNDLDYAVDVVGIRRQCFPDFSTLARKGRVLYATDGVTVSGGADVLVTAIGYFDGK